MISISLTLPDGRRGQALALGLTAAIIALVWLTAAAPLLGWYEARAAELAQHRLLAARMAALGQQIPALRAAVSAAGISAKNQVLLAGSTDAIADANLQSALHDLAVQAGTSLDSAAQLPTQQDGALRRIGMRVSVTATWPVLVALLEEIDTAHPYMIVDGLSINSNAQPPQTDQEPALQASFSVSGFQAGNAP
jgi:general secretion pathway protein M